ncbi:MAG: PKD domain-containing protein [Candidatus Thermoplasmatota archaeon]|jgi:hypothetical protein|nr:PKD domain-containing protein [Candidatus Thermoplasmatota archaeon]
MSSSIRPTVILIILFLVLAGLPDLVFPYSEVIFPVGISKGETIVVNASGGGDYTIIQWAVDNASNGDTINVQPGTYSERVIINKSIRLIGTDPRDVFIDGEGQGHCLNIENSNDNEISNITTYNGDYGIYISNSNNNNINNIFSPNNQEGIHITNSVGNRLENILNWNNARGIYIKYSNKIEILNSSMKNNTIGVDIFNSAAVTIENVSYLNNGIELTSSPNIEMKNSSISAPNTPDLTLSSNSDIAILNSSFDKNDANTDGGSYVNVNWYFSLILNNTLGWPIENAVVRIKDNANGSYDNNFNTDAGGKIPKIILKEYTENTGAKTFFTPFNVTVSTNGYHTGYIYPEPEMQESGVASITLIDNQPPHANAGNDIVTNQHTLITLDGSASQDNLLIKNFSWHFNYNGTTEVLYEQNPAFFFDNAGYFPIRMNVTDNDGNWAEDVVNITVNDTTLPVVNAGADMEADQQDTVIFNGSLSHDNVDIVNLTWTLTYNHSIRELYDTTPAFVFDLAGRYNVTLSGIDEAGNRATDNLTLLIRDIERPVVDAGRDRTVDQGDRVVFNGSLSRDNVAVDNYTWDFHYDEQDYILYGASVNFTFHIPGIYSITLRVNDSSGNSAEDTMTITVRDTEPPAADAGIDLVLNQGTLVTFNGSASNDNVGVVNYTWTFTDGENVELYRVTPTYLFTNAGGFPIVLKVTDAMGNLNESTLTVTVLDIEEPAARAGPDRYIDQDETVLFNGSGSKDNMGIVLYVWSLGEGALILYGEQSSHTFKEAGIFDIVLNVSDDAGNWHVDIFTVNVNDTTIPTAVAGPDRTLNQEGGSWLDGLNSTDNMGVHRYFWTYYERGASQSISGGRIWIIFHFPGVYNVTLEVTDKAGNLDLDYVNVTVVDTEKPVAYTGPDKTVRENELLRFDGSGSSDNAGVSNYSWQFTFDKKEIILYGENPVFLFDIAGYYNVSLVVKDAGGNEDRDFIVVTVKRNETTSVSGDKSALFGWWTLMAVPVLLCIIFLTILLRKKRSGKRKADEEPEPSLEETSEALTLTGSGPIIPLASSAQLKKKPGIGGPIVPYEGTVEVTQTVKKREEITIIPKGGIKKFSGAGRKSLTHRKKVTGDKEPMLTSSQNSISCRICLGVIKGGLPMIKCGCGREYHDSCALRVGICPSCDLDLNKWMNKKKAGRVRSSDEKPLFKPSHPKSPPKSGPKKDEVSCFINNKKTQNKRFDVDSTYMPEVKAMPQNEDLFLPPATFIDLGDQEKELPIDEIFLMTSYGLLIKHYTFKKITDLNVDVLSSMLVAVKNFITDSVYGRLSKKGISMDLKKIDFGDISVMFACGEDINIVAVVTEKRIKGIGDQLDKAVEKIEKRYKKSLIDWDGEVKKLDDVKTYMEELVLGNYK